MNPVIDGSSRERLRSNLRAGARETEAILVYTERSVTTPFREMIENSPNHLQVVEDPARAEVIIFENDEPDYVRSSAEFRNWPDKCVVVSERDEPTYYLPACYASNQSCWLGRGRTKTIPYLISQRMFANPFITSSENDESEQRYLYSFIGGSTSWVRKRIFRKASEHDDAYIEETNHYHHWNFEPSYSDQKSFLRKRYAEVLRASLFCLCPRGAGVSSIRLFDVMQAGRTPVIIADGWIPVEHMPWSEFAIFLDEKDLPHLGGILRSKESAARKMGRVARQAWEDYCAPGMDSALLARTLRDIQSERNENKERFIRFVFPIFQAKYLSGMIYRKIAKRIILWIFSLTRRKFPYSLNRPLDE